MGAAMLADWFNSMEFSSQVSLLLFLSLLGALGAVGVATAAATGKGVLGALAGRSPTFVILNSGVPAVLPVPDRRFWNFGRMWLLAAAILSGPWLLILVVKTLVRVGTALVDHWWIPLVVGCVAALGFFVRYAIGEHRDQVAVDQQAEAYRVPQSPVTPQLPSAPVAGQVIGWQAPDRQAWGQGDGLR